MKNERKTEIKVGITVTLSLLLFIWIFGWAKNFTLSTDRKEVQIEYTQTAGLEVGDQVTINGVILRCSFRNYYARSNGWKKS
jgi:phospholipid/cholesterol/gamma-HCH transport system substrate-binding protein